MVDPLPALDALRSSHRFRGQKDTDSLVLHIVRIKGVAEAATLAGPTDLTTGAVEAILAGLAATGLVEHRDAAPVGWRPTAAGVEHDDAWLAEGLASGDARTGVGEAYRSFLTLNPELLGVCTAWQLKSADGVAPAVNDHTDAEYDAAVVARLGDLHRRILPVLEELERSLPRFGPYRRRLHRALERVQAGDGDWFTRPLLDSYHQVWFELHQDFLLTLALERGGEEVGGAEVGEHERPGRPR